MSTGPLLSARSAQTTAAAVAISNIFSARSSPLRRRAMKIADAMAAAVAWTRYAAQASTMQDSPDRAHREADRIAWNNRRDQSGLRVLWVLESASHDLVTRFQYAGCRHDTRREHRHRDLDRRGGDPPGDHHRRIARAHLCRADRRRAVHETDRPRRDGRRAAGRDRPRRRRRLLTLWRRHRRSTHRTRPGPSHRAGLARNDLGTRRVLRRDL